jgi:hypothetical protein
MFDCGALLFLAAKKLLWQKRCCFVFILSSADSFAQKTAVEGRVYDSTIQKGLAYTTVSLVRARDSALVTFARQIQRATLR